MSEWTTYRLGDISEKIGSGATPRGGKEAYLDCGEISLIRSQNILDFSFSKNGLAYISAEQAHDLRNVIVEEDDVFLNITGDSVARVCQVPLEILPARVNQHVAIIRGKKEILNQSFLKYYLLEPSFKRYMLGLASAGATRNALTKVMIENFEIKAPEIDDQIEIASILSSLDDKIELNLQMNQTLEALAHEIYDEWFVKQAVDDWPSVRLGDILEIRGGLSYQGQFIGTGEALLLGMGCVSFNERFLISGARKYSGEFGKKHLVVPGDIVLATRQQSDNLPILGFPAKIPISFEGKNVIAGANLYKVVNKSMLSNSSLFQLFRSDEYRKHILSNSKGSTVRMITKDTIEDFKFKMPPTDFIVEFENAIKIIDEKLEYNNNENKILVELRDALLPKLINGKIEVKA